MDFLSVFKKQPEKLSIDEIAKILEKDPEAVKAFEKEYKKQVLDINGGNGILGPDAKSASKRDVSGNSALVSSYLQKIKNDIVLEFLSRTYLIRIINGCVSERLPDCPVDLVTKEQLMQIPKDIRPQCSGSLAIRDMPDEAEDLVLWNLKCYFDEQDIKKKKTYYAMFRQGLDSMDLGRYMWAMLSVAPMSMSNWIIPLAESVRNTENSIFKIPNTTVVRVPLCLLQMSRMDYEILNQTTRDIINDYCIKAFQLDTKKQYFIKTGVYSSKFDFRNAKVTDPDEIRQIGEYLTFISNQACQHTFSLNGISYYGAATTADWVVREFIPDKENNLTIYNGLPLRTEYRVFIDCDQDSVIGISPYWEPEVMKNHLSGRMERGDKEALHDYVTYSANENRLMERYHLNKNRIISEVERLLPALDLKGQWSLDIMQNGDDFWLIDMAWMQESAHNECVPEELRNPHVLWVPDFSESNLFKKQNA